MTIHFRVRQAENADQDIKALTEFMHKLALYDGHSAKIDAKMLKDQLFYPDTNIRAFFAERKGKPIGFILFYECFTVYHGQRGVSISGAYIDDEFRNKGYGVKLLKSVAEYAVEQGYSYMNWIVKDTNDSALRLYKKMGAYISEDWNYIRIPPKKLKEMVK
jgi:ribosomal protein S18 acetylase RimI-like enzyme